MLEKRYTKMLSSHKIVLNAIVNEYFIVEHIMKIP